LSQRRCLEFREKGGCLSLCPIEQKGGRVKDESHQNNQFTKKKPKNDRYSQKKVEAYWKFRLENQMIPLIPLIACI
jgi:hypothetical protein